MVSSRKDDNFFAKALLLTCFCYFVLVRQCYFGITQLPCEVVPNAEWQTNIGLGSSNRGVGGSSHYSLYYTLHT